MHLPSHALATTATTYHSNKQHSNMARAKGILENLHGRLDNNTTICHRNGKAFTRPAHILQPRLHPARRHPLHLLPALHHRAGPPSRCRLLRRPHHQRHLPQSQVPLSFPNEDLTHISASVPKGMDVGNGSVCYFRNSKTGILGGIYTSKEP